MQRTTLFAALVACASATPVIAAPTAAAGFNLSTFAAPPAGTSGADSVEIVGSNVYVGYSNGTPKDGSAGSSTIAQYTLSGALVSTVSIPGHTDGLRYDPTSGKLWAMQNEDANANLVLVTPGTLALSGSYSFSSINGGGGFDDVAFVDGKAIASASNPANSPNASPALFNAKIVGSSVINDGNVLLGNASATPLNPGAPSTLNLQDPDSITISQDGRLVLTSQADSQLVFVSNPATSPSASVLQLKNGVMVDDTLFPRSAHGTLLFADKSTDIIYAVTGTFSTGTGYSAAQDANAVGFIGQLNSDGSYMNVVTGLGNPGGEAFIASVPEPTTLSLFGLGLAGVAAWRRKRIAKQ